MPRSSSSSSSTSKSKKPRGSRGVRSNTRIYHDLNVPYPTTTSSEALTTSTKQERTYGMLHRLSEMGYSVIALSHTIYGKPRNNRDEANIAISFPKKSKAWSGSDVSGNNSNSESKQSSKKRRKEVAKDVFPRWNGNTFSHAQSNGPPPMKLLRRLNVVIEELADVGYFGGSTTDTKQPTDDTTSTTTTPLLLNSYDIIALSPRNDATFQAICTSAQSIDVIMLDYNPSSTPGFIGRGRLPFRLRRIDVRAATELGIAFEICYGPALIDPSRRSYLIQTAREFEAACVGIRPVPKLVLSSGVRMGLLQGANALEDVGPIVLRSPGDLLNVLKVVLGFDDEISQGAMGASAQYVLHRGLGRRSTGGGDSGAFANGSGSRSSARRVKNNRNRSNSAISTKVQVFTTTASCHNEEEGKDGSFVQAPFDVKGMPSVGDFKQIMMLPVAKEVLTSNSKFGSAKKKKEEHLKDDGFIAL